MEELRNLERVHKMLSFVETLGVSTKDRDSDRFLADFLLFMVKPCGALDMKTRCDLIHELLPKISTSALVETLHSENNEGFLEVAPAHCSQYDLEVSPEYCSQAIVSFDAMQRAKSTVEDFLDALNEKKLLRLAEDSSQKKNFHQHSRFDPFEPLIYFLQQRELMNEHIMTELKFGVEYWKLERKLCDELAQNKKILIEDVMRAIHLKSFDYRVLNLLLYQLRGQPVNKVHMEFLSVSEFLVEVADDLYDYEEDVIDDTFNILRMFVGIHGARKAAPMLAKCITKAEEKYEQLSSALDPELSLKSWRRYEEATREGRSVEGHVVGKWTIPPIILDEELFRITHSTMFAD
ncbi:hypothetical protein AXF42_Ash017652 [Apostasia shenzhenica]|uniref:Uncharacterized protein n=1 Tax=Apostasia shenzhenica TaxID=1088818 RepID=A0A2I0A5F8_9ASPA|nr:hypothetical protein AXF42_Ash017652 [Apostasia shenzhenica]